MTPGSALVITREDHVEPATIELGEQPPDEDDDEHDEKVEPVDFD